MRIWAPREPARPAHFAYSHDIDARPHAQTDKNKTKFYGANFNALVPLMRTAAQPLRGDGTMIDAASMSDTSVR
jgi:hypothetical protein